MQYGAPNLSQGKEITLNNSEVTVDCQKLPGKTDQREK